MEKLRSDKYLTYEFLNDMREMGLDDIASDFEMIRKEGLKDGFNMFEDFGDLCRNELKESGFVRDDVDELKTRFLMIFMYQLGYESHMKVVDDAFEEVEVDED